MDEADQDLRKGAWTSEGVWRIARLIGGALGGRARGQRERPARAHTRAIRRSSLFAQQHRGRRAHQGGVQPRHAQLERHQLALQGAQRQELPPEVRWGWARPLAPHIAPRALS